MLLQVLIVQGGAVAKIAHHLNTIPTPCGCPPKGGQPANCYCGCSKSAAARLLGKLCSDQVAQIQLPRHSPVSALLQMLTGGCKSTVLYHNFEGNELVPPCDKSRQLMESAAEYALLKMACHCDEEFKEHMLNVCLSFLWMGHNVPVALLLL